MTNLSEILDLAEKATPHWPEANSDTLAFYHAANPSAVSAIVRELMELREAVNAIMPYLRWTISDESPGHHPTMPSAVAVVEAALRSLSHGGSHEQ